MFGIFERKLRSWGKVIVGLILPFVMACLVCYIRSYWNTAAFSFVKILCFWPLFFTYKGVYELTRSKKEVWKKFLAAAGMLAAIFITVSYTHAYLVYQCNLSYWSHGSYPNFLIGIKYQPWRSIMRWIEWLPFAILAILTIVTTVGQKFFFKVIDIVKGLFRHVEEKIITWMISLEEDDFWDEDANPYYRTIRNNYLYELESKWLLSEDISGAYLLLGESGSGKTTYLQNLCEKLQNISGYDVEWYTASGLTEKMIQAFKEGKTLQLKGDVFVVEHMDSLRGKEQTQKLFMDLINDLKESDCLVICTAEEDVFEGKAPMEVIDFYPTKPTFAIIDKEAENIGVELSLIEKFQLYRKTNIWEVQQGLKVLKLDHLLDDVDEFEVEEEKMEIKGRKIKDRTKIIDSAIDLIGETPLLRASRYAEKVGVEDAVILAKLEYLNPTGSVKDRAALAMIEDAERKGILKPGATIIEPTSGNTGIGLASVAAIKGYRAILTLPETMSVERRNLLKGYGAELVLTEGSLGMGGAIAKAQELRAEINGAVILGQFDNPANPKAHEETTGPEIWNQTEGCVDVFVATVGTGGTLSGTAAYLKERNPDIHIVAVEPAGSPVLSEGKAGKHGIQGIGAGFVPNTLNVNLYDEVITVTDEEAYEESRNFARSEGVQVGISSGAALKAATIVAKRPEYADQNIVVLLPDSGDRYLSTALFQE